ncbi:MAG: type IV pilin protein [Gammaproteobacteria bacterium]|nr:type IV pilin protein [Gammaproteobacteria bacterium]
MLIYDYQSRNLLQAQRQNGFSLLELMIVVALMGIIMSIALPSYQDSIQKARRSDAMSALMDAANRQEQFMLDNNSYSTNLADIGMVNPTPEGHYNIAIVEATVACPITRCYVLSATADGDSPQSEETKCTVYRLTSVGAKTNDGTLGTDCW